MAQYDILSCEFPGGSEPAELEVSIDNPEGMQLHINPQHNVPGDVEIVPPGDSPGQRYWVHQEDYHLTITLSGSGGSNPLVVGNTAYFDSGGTEKWLDVVLAENEDEEKRTKRVKRRIKRVSSG